MLIGIIGKANVGKSTFYKAATLAEVLIANYPFATIKPNHGVAYVKIPCIDSEFKVQCMPRTGFCINHIRFVPVDLMDVAGLVPGASEGKGLGNQFLSDLSQADCFIHVVDASGGTTIEGKPAEPGSHDPIEDIKFIERELDLWYLGILKKVWRVFARTISTVKDAQFAKEVAKQFSGLKIDEDLVKRVLLKNKLNADKPDAWTDNELEIFARGLRIMSKPMIIAANKCDTSFGKTNAERLAKEFPEYLVVPCSADSELALRQAAKAGLIEYVPGECDFKLKKELLPKQLEALEAIKKNVLAQFKEGTGVQAVLNHAVFDLLKYIAIFPAGAHKLADSKGNILPDCFLLPSGSTALDFAFSLHSDIGKNFVKAIDARTGKALGKDHVLQHRDALEIATR
ncbi:redox-regulated ATPase YchF [Candidatus Pacearchaeota archaeon]|nr:redox-regulated ATPase YchF [Candidatus Pacearchaeota archaeon]